MLKFFNQSKCLKDSLVSRYDLPWCFDYNQGGFVTKIATSFRNGIAVCCKVAAPT